MDRTQALELFRTSVGDLIGVMPADLDLGRSWDDYEIDSLGVTEVALILTDTFGVCLPDAEPEDFRTVGQAFEMVVQALPY